MPQDAFTILHTANELNKTIANSRVDKINQPDDDTIFMNIRADKCNLKLVISANAQNARVCVTNEEKTNPLTAPGFCMLLRKHLTRAVIKNVSIVGLERIFKISFDCKNDLHEETEKYIYAEIMGKFSNIILVERNVILGAIKQSTLDEGNLRPIFNGLEYTLPISQDKTEIYNDEETKTRLATFAGGSSPETFLFENFKGLAKSTAEEIIYRFKEKFPSENNFVKNFKSEEFRKFFKNFYVTPNIEPNTVYTTKPLDFFITDYKCILGEKTKFSTINEATDCFFIQKMNLTAFNNKKAKILSVVNQYQKKETKTLQILLERKLSCQDMQQNKQYGELIMSNIYALKQPVESVELNDYNLPDYPIVKIKLDKTITPKENAEKFFKKYNKQKKTLVAIEPLEKELTEMLDYLSNMIDEINQATTIDELKDFEEELVQIEIINGKKGKKQKETPSKPRKFVYNGYEIYVGRNNIQNDQLTLSADRMDMWLHTKDYHSSHVIIKNNNEEIPDNVILIASELCAYYSKARNGEKVPVDYTLKKFVKKIKDSFVGKVYYTNQKTILVTPNAHIELSTSK